MSPKPSFSSLVLYGLASVEITYISMEHLRKAKKNMMTKVRYNFYYVMILLLLLVFVAGMPGIVQSDIRPHTYLSEWFSM